MALGTILPGGAVAALGTLLGVHLARAHPGFSARASRPFVALAGGIVIGAAFLHLLPEATGMAGEAAWLAAVAAFLLLYLAECHTLPHVHGPHSGDVPETAPPHVHLGHFAAVGFTVHAVFDGLALGAGARRGAGVAASTMLAVVAHKIPEGMALLTLLVQGGYPEGRALRYATFVALATPLSAVVAYSALAGPLSPATMGLWLAFVAGSFLYISAVDLLPEVRRHPAPRDSALLVAGVGLMALLRTL